MTDSGPGNPTDRPGMPGHDIPNPGTPSRFYMIASVPRSGSNLLCDILTQTGYAGAPLEYVGGAKISRSRERWGELSIPDYLREVMKVRTSPNGVFGIKVQFDQLKHLTSRGLVAEDLFPGLTYIRVRRGDMIRQAISLVRAGQTKQWNSLRRPRTRPDYNAGAIYRGWQRLVKWEAGWDAFFAERGVEPLTIYYEQLDTDLKSAIRLVLRHLGVDRPDMKIPLPTIARQRDDLTEDWYRRFVRDCKPGPLAMLNYRLYKNKMKRLSGGANIQDRNSV